MRPPFAGTAQMVRDYQKRGSERRPGQPPPDAALSNEGREQAEQCQQGKDDRPAPLAREG